MLRIVAENYIRSGAKEKYLELASQLVEATRREEGNISYALHQDAADENHLTFIEEWKDEEAIKLHNESEHFTTLVPRMHAFAEKPGNVCVYKVLL